jgi:hypothetical protein
MPESPQSAKLECVLICAQTQAVTYALLVIIHFSGVQLYIILMLVILHLVSLVKKECGFNLPDVLRIYFPAEFCIKIYNVEKSHFYG